MNFLDILMILCIVFMLFVGGILVGVMDTRTQAVNNGAGYWCIVDHEKVFSWKPCEEF